MYLCQINKKTFLVITVPGAEMSVRGTLSISPPTPYFYHSQPLHLLLVFFTQLET
jgi:hypothetical protein